MTMTHYLRLGDGYGETPVELLQVDGPLAAVRIRANAYWEPERFTIRSVRLDALRPIKAEGAA
jgi:hypothetical protein